MSYVFMIISVIGVATMFLSVFSYNKKHDLLMNDIAESKGVKSIFDYRDKAQNILKLHFYVVIFGLFLMSTGFIGGVLWGALK